MSDLGTSLKTAIDRISGTTTAKVTILDLFLLLILMMETANGRMTCLFHPISGVTILQNYANDKVRPHDGFLTMAKPYIAAFKAGAQTVDSYIEEDQLIYWYRPTLKSASCDSTDTCENASPDPGANANYFAGKPNGYETMSDSVFVVALLKSAGTLQVTSGGNSQSFNAEAGASIFQVAMGTGKQSFSLTRGGQTVLSGDSLKDIISDCVCGIYNFNAYVGTLPATPSEPLQEDGLKSFAVSLQATCQATPSLGTASGGDSGNPTGPGPTATVGASSVVSSPSVPSTSSVAPSTSASSSIPSPPSYAPPINPITTTAAPLQELPTPTSTTKNAGSDGGVSGENGSKTITAISQLSPTNCMHAGYVWAGPPGSDPAAYCDGG